MSKHTADLYTGGLKKNLVMKWVRTPTIIWEQLSNEFYFTVDACASDKNHLLPRYWTKETDALEQCWDNETIYCHPMFDIRIPKFVEKGCTASNSLCVFLLPSSTNSVYFHKWFWDADLHRPKKNVEIRFIPKPKRHADGWKFCSEDGVEPEMGYLRPLMVVVVNNKVFDYE